MMSIESPRERTIIQTAIAQLLGVIRTHKISKEALKVLEVGFQGMGGEPVTFEDHFALRETYTHYEQFSDFLMDLIDRLRKCPGGNKSNSLASQIKYHVLDGFLGKKEE